MSSFRVGVPRYDRRGVREAVNNALIHRDYGQLGAIHLQLRDDEALVSNPGGFVANVHVEVGPTIIDLSSAQLEEQLLAQARRQGRIQRGQVEAMSGLSRDQAYRLLQGLVREGKLEMVGRGRAAYYRPADLPPADKS